MNFWIENHYLNFIYCSFTGDDKDISEDTDIMLLPHKCPYQGSAPRVAGSPW